MHLRPRQLALLGTVILALSSLTAPSALADTPPTAPSAPVGVQATSGESSITVSWGAPSSDGGSPLVSYTATAYDPTNAVAGSCTSTPDTQYCTITGLTDGTPYSYAAYATNAVGDSSPAVSTTLAIPGSAPSSPTSLVTTPASSSVTLSWGASTQDHGGPVLSYTATAYDQNQVAVASCSTAPDQVPLSCVVTGLTNGTAYSFSVVALNQFGTSDPSAPATATPVPVPSPPQGVYAVAANGQVTVTWAAPVDNGGSPVTGYVASATPGSHSCSTDGYTYSCVITGLTNATSYLISVTATNTAGSSLPATANPATITPFTVPDAPTNVTITPGNQQASLAWAAPAHDNGSPVTSYVATVFGPGNSPVATCTTTGLVLGCTVAPLLDSVPYQASVVAYNAAGASLASSLSAPATPATTPSAPTDVSATLNATSATVSWARPTDDGGAPITSYLVTALPGQQTCTALSSASSCVVTGLTYGTSYTFSVSAVNRVGTGPASAPSPALTPRTTPSSPEGVQAHPANASAIVTWTAPTSNGGSSITSYTVIGMPDHHVCQTTATTCTVTGLVNGVTYDFTVTATNAQGSSPTSSASNLIIPLTTPSAPTSLTDRVVGSVAYLSWAVPATNGGSAVTSYTLLATNRAKGTRVGGCVQISATTCTISGLNMTTSYVFSVTSTNAAGVSAASTISIIATALGPFATNSSSLSSAMRPTLQSDVAQFVAAHLTHLIVVGYKEPTVSATFGAHLTTSREAATLAYLRTVLGWYALTPSITVLTLSTANPSGAHNCLIISLR